VADDARREILGWEQFGAAGRGLASTVVDDGYRPDLLLAIARGGLLIAGAMSYALGMKNCCVINVEYYTGVDERLDVPVLLPPHLDLLGQQLLSRLRVVVALAREGSRALGRELVRWSQCTCIHGDARTREPAR
jgi:hypoxanthine phosphoribosyltransferase